MKDSNNLRTVYDKLKLSTQMSHFVSTQQDYYKKADYLCDPVIDTTGDNLLFGHHNKYSCLEDKRKAKLVQTRLSNMRRKERLQNEKKEVTKRG